MKSGYPFVGLRSQTRPIIAASKTIESLVNSSVTSCRMIVVSLKGSLSNCLEAKFGMLLGRHYHSPIYDRAEKAIPLGLKRL